MIVDQLFTKKLNESLADQIMQSARAAGLNPRLAGTPEQERERSQQILAQRAQEREQQAQQAAMDDARNLMALKTEYKQMKDRYESLGGSNWQYADREQNLTDREREARGMEPALQRLAGRIHAAEKVITKESRQRRKIDEAWLMEDPVYRNFKVIGRYIAERRMSEKEILQVFADAEAGMTDKGTGANRTFLGRGKDTAMDFAGGVADALKSVWSGIQSSVPVAAVDVAYDQATDALAKLTGGQKGAVMQAIKKYRMLAKQYPKTAGLAKGALVAITGLATGGAGLPAAAALIYGLDSAIKGEKFSDIALKAGGAAATAWAAGKIASAFGNQPAGGGMGDPSQLPPFDDAGNLAPGFHINPEDGIPYYNGELTPTSADIAAGYGPDDVAGLTGTTRFDDIVANAVDYKIKDGDTLTQILADRKINPEAFKRLPGNETYFSPEGNPDVIKAGQTIKLPRPEDVGTLNKMFHTTPDAAGGNLQRFLDDPNYYTGQYNPNNNRFSLDAATNLKQQELGRYASSDIAANRVAQDAARASGGPELLGGPAAGDVAPIPSAASDFGTGGSAPIDYSQAGPVSTDSLGQKLEYGIPVNDKGSFIPPNSNLPADELARQTAAYNSWKADFMKRFPGATQLPDGTMQGIKPGLAPMYPSNAPTGALPPGITPKVQESVKFKKLPFNKLVDEKSTVLTWALNESVGRQSRSVHLTTVGTYTVFENVDRYRKAIMELKGVPGSTRPEYYRPDMSGAPDPTKPPKNQSWFGKGLDYLDKGVKKVGGALSNFGHQFTTNVTKEKLKMNWHQAGKPSDSDQLAAWLVKQGVPQEVVTTVYGKMGIPYTAPAVAPAVEPTPVDNKAKKTLPWLGKDLTTGELRTVDQYTPAPTNTTADTTATDLSGLNFKDADGATDTTPGSTTTTAGGGAGAFGNMAAQLAARPTTSSTGGTTTGVSGVGKGVVRHTASATNPNQKFADPTAAAKATPSTPVPDKTATLPAGGGAGVTAANPFGSMASSLAGDKEKKPAPVAETAKVQRIVSALEKPVAEMLQMVETKDDVNQIKKFIDQTFTKYGAVNESAFAVRNKMIEHVTQVGAQRRREHARQS